MLNPAEFPDDVLEREYQAVAQRGRERFGQFRDAHERAGFHFQGSKMAYQHGASPDFTSWGGGPATIEGGEPTHAYRVEGAEGMQRLREQGELASNFGGGSAYTHFSRYPEGKYADPGAHVLRVANAPGRLRAKTTLDRAYAVADQPIPAADVEDLGPASEFRAWSSGKPALSEPVQVEDYLPEPDPYDSAVSDEHITRSMSKLGRARTLGEIFGAL